MTDSSKFSCWLRDKRLEANLSIRELGRKSKIAHTLIADAEKGVRPSVNTVKKLADYFGESQENALRMAGWLDDKASPKDYIMDLIVTEGNDLDENDRNEVLSFIRMKLKLGQERGKYEAGLNGVAKGSRRPKSI